MTFGRHWLSAWMLDPAITYLNHGTVGAVPRRTLAAQQQIRDEMEREPSRFMLREVSGWIGGSTGHSRMRQAAAAVARFVRARADDVVFVDNASAGVGAVLRSLPFAPGDEILLTDHNYGAVAKAAMFVARQHGARVTTVALPYPAFDPGRVVAAIEQALTPATRVAVLDHITSETALVLPLRQMTERCHARGVPVLADGAHAPGALDLDIPSIGVDWYVANLHKWAHAPRSCGILWAAPDQQSLLHPPVISWGLDQGFTAEFDWVGTRDPSPWLAAPAGLAFLEEIGFEDARRYMHGLAWRAAEALTNQWKTTLEIDESTVASMVTIPLPESLGTTGDEAVRLRNALLFEDRIEVHVHARGGRLWARLSAQIYNDWDDVVRLGEAVSNRTR